MRYGVAMEFNIYSPNERSWVPGYNPRGSDFQSLSSRVLVTDIMHPIGGTIAAETSIKDAEAQVFADAESAHIEATDHIWLLYDRNGAIGYVTLRSDCFHDPPESDRVGDGAEPIGPTDFIAANSTALAATRYLSACESDRLFVIDGTAICGVLQHDCVFHPLFRVCLFAMTIQLEELMLVWLIRHADEAWEKLSKEDVESVRNTFRNRYQDLSFDSAKPSTKLGCLTFHHRKKLFLKLDTPDDWPETWPKNRLRSVLHQIKGIRNNLAHPSEDQEWPVQLRGAAFTQLLDDCHDLMKILEGALSPDDGTQT